MKRLTAMTRNFSTSAVKGDLYKFQSKLPKLPVPTLQETTEKYIKSVTPLLLKSQLEITKKNVESFLAKQGPQLQSKLENFALTKDNWLAEWWDDYAYLSYRDPIVPYVSYFFAHKDLNNAIGKNQLIKATLIAHHTIEFSKSVETETLDPEIIKGNPYCMNAFRYMFNNSRVPQAVKDTNVLYPPAEHRYFIVAYKNNFFKVSTELSKEEIYSHLQAIKNYNKQGDNIGILTSLHRDDFTTTYNRLQSSPVNIASFEALFASSFIIALDSTPAVTVEEKSIAYWHNHGQNRYFDKPLEFFVSSNGSSGFLGEHSKMDATPTVQLNNYVLENLKKEDASFISNVSTVATPAPLQWDLDSQSKADISQAQIKFDNLMSTYDNSIFHFYGYGKNLIKKFKVSPDAYVQLLMQLAYYKLTGEVRPTYESAATRKFLNGRTETGRSVSIESKEFVETWTNPSSSIEDRISTFQKAAGAHVKYLSEAADGKGVDRHLFGLKNMLESGEEVPDLFKDPVFSYSQTWFLSTSQVPSENFISWGFSQVIDEGVGLAYLVQSEWLNVHISSKKGQGIDSKHLKWYLTESANELKDILSKGLLEPKAKL